MAILSNERFGMTGGGSKGCGVLESGSGRFGMSEGSSEGFGMSEGSSGGFGMSGGSSGGFGMSGVVLEVSLQEQKQKICSSVQCKSLHHPRAMF